MNKLNLILIIIFIKNSICMNQISPLEAQLSKLAKGPIQDAIDSGAANDYKKEDCTWRRGDDKDLCPDPDIHIYLYTPGDDTRNETKRELKHSDSSDWLQRDYDPTRENIILIHGYAGKRKINLFLII